MLREVKKEQCCNTGGPGFEAPRPTEASAWLKAAVQHFRVILLDQRGTGRSSAITTASLLRIGDAGAQAEYLAHFRCAKFRLATNVTGCQTMCEIFCWTSRQLPWPQPFLCSSPARPEEGYCIRDASGRGAMRDLRLDLRCKCRETLGRYETRMPHVVACNTFMAYIFDADTRRKKICSQA